ncbi:MULTISPECIES: creatininase family protein [Hyphomicrobiales]|jgi:creatinine amidohydrolase|uniref:creatininase family protein n=1 Tax=Hyphomicrobiales TaxID=356 RepID=UPI0004763DD8|nr:MULTISPECIES: creatininase family protein [Phyllobacteriaceae]MCX8569046.1 creatininase family protein [Aminobacter sp. MET-1]
MAREVEWARMTAPDLREIAARGNAMAILPVGSLEQHGPHLPVITDTASAEAAARRAARLIADDVPLAVLPGLWLGMSEHHLPFGGTISLDYTAYFHVLKSIVRSLKAIGFERLLIVNGHGGNIDPLAMSTRELAVEFAMPIVYTTPWMLAPEETAALFETDNGPKHACEGEASVMLAISPDTVKSDKFEEAFTAEAGKREAPDGAHRFYSFSERAPNTGTWGVPAKGTVEKGELFLDLHARELAKLIVDPILWTRPDPVWRAGRGLGTRDGRAD